MSFLVSFHRPQPDRTSHALSDSPADLTCKNRTRQFPPDDEHTPPKQQVAGSSPARGAINDQLRGHPVRSLPCLLGHGYARRVRTPASAAETICPAQDPSWGQSAAKTAADWPHEGEWSGRAGWCASRD